MSFSGSGVEFGGDGVAVRLGERLHALAFGRDQALERTALSVPSVCLPTASRSLSLGLGLEPMRTLFFIASWLILLVPRLLAEPPQLSPLKSFSITQRQGDDRWDSILHFLDGKSADIQLGDGYAWPALFSISPNDEWIMQIQKSGSGSNIAILYRLERPTRRVWRLQANLEEFALDFLARVEGFSVEDLYHTGVSSPQWSLQKHELRFRVQASGLKGRDGGLHRDIIYDLQRHVIRLR